MIAQANSIRIPLADNSVHCVVTSIPYWGLRDYGLEPVIWGGRADCRHEWTGITVKRNGGGERDYGSYDGATGRGPGVANPESDFCHLCGAWRGSLGLEPTPALFIQNIVSVFREVWRVLRPDGQLWLNIGDSYATAPNGRSAAATKAAGNDDRTFRDKPFSTAVGGLKPKDLCGIPWRVAFALQDDGWYLRSDIIWAKPNPMPESVEDRPTKAHEYLFLMTKQERYFYDAEAVREPHKLESLKRDELGYAAAFKGRHTMPGEHRPHSTDHNGFCNPAGRNRRTVWEIATQSYSGTHFATFPTKLVEPCILAGTSARGCCPKCGAGWRRVVEKSVSFESGSGKAGNKPIGKYNGSAQAESGSYDIRMGPVTHALTAGWQPSCSCYRTTNPTKRRRQDLIQERYDELAEVAENTAIPELHRLGFIQAAADMKPYLWTTRVARNKTAPTVPAITFDPFCGSGTVGEVARQLGRRFIGLDLNPSYLALNALPRAEGKTAAAALRTIAREGQYSMFGEAA